MATLEQLKAADKKLADQRRKIRAAIKGTPPSDGSDERTRDAERKREQRQLTREVVIPKCACKSRRTRLEKCDEFGLLVGECFYLLDRLGQLDAFAIYEPISAFDISYLIIVETSPFQTFAVYAFRNRWLTGHQRVSRHIAIDR